MTQYQPTPQPLPRAKCPVCLKSVALRKGGLLREHHINRPPTRALCPASGKHPREARRMARDGG